MVALTTTSLGSLLQQAEGACLDTAATADPASFECEACDAGFREAPGLEGLGSIGSRLHKSGMCMPCTFVDTKRGCVYGGACTLCHLPHEELTRSAKRSLIRRAFATKQVHRACDEGEQSQHWLPMDGSISPTSKASTANSCQRRLALDRFGSGKSTSSTASMASTRSTMSSPTRSTRSTRSMET